MSNQKTSVVQDTQVSPTMTPERVVCILDTDSSEEEVDEEEKEEEYVVEKILNKKFIKGRPYYFLKWENYEEKFNTWESIDNLNCPELLAEFEKKWKNSKKRGRRWGSGKSSKRIELEDDEEEEVSQESKQTAAAILRSLRKPGDPGMSGSSQDDD